MALARCRVGENPRVVHFLSWKDAALGYDGHEVLSIGLFNIGQNDRSEVPAEEIVERDCCAGRPP